MLFGLGVNYYEVFVLDLDFHGLIERQCALR